MIRRILSLLAVIALAAVARAQSKPFKHEEELNLERDRMLREKEQQSVREGRLIHLLIRHGLGLKVDAKEFSKLTKSEEGMSETAARNKLHGIQSDLAARAAELEKLAAQTGADPDGVTEMVPNEPKTAPGPRTIPDSPGDAGSAYPTNRHGTGQHNPGRRNPGAVGRQPERSPTSRPTTVHTPGPRKDVASPKKQPIRAIIRGSGNRSVVGRILFKAGKYEQALKELAPLEKDESASLADLFYLARCNEELHTRVKELADAATKRARTAKAIADDAGARAGKLTTARRKNKVVGGSAAAKDEIDLLLKKQSDALAEYRAESQLAKAKATEAATYYDNAYNVLILIEGRDTVRNKDGVDVPGEWAKTARAARNMLIWLATKKEWVPPQIQWNLK